MRCFYATVRLLSVYDLEEPTLVTHPVVANEIGNWKNRNRK